MTVMDIRVEIEDVGTFDEIEQAIRQSPKFKGKKIYELRCLNID